MAESVSANSQTETSPLTGPSSFGSALDAQGLQTVHELPRIQPKYNDNVSLGSLDKRLFSKGQSPGDFRDASPDSFFARTYSEKQLEASPRRLRHTAPAHTAPEAWQRSKGPSPPLHNGNYRNPKRESALKQTPQKKEKERKAGFRNTLRRMFTRRSTRDRISMPTPPVYPRHDPEEFITSATDVQAKRSASVPTNGVLRTSGLGSHPPFQKSPSPVGATSDDVPSSDIKSNDLARYEATNNSIPPQPELLPPDRPARPRRASVPSVILNRPEVKELEAAMTGLGLQTNAEQPVDTHNIGFAVTNGSNPKRRSRSVGAFRDTQHRMSPIQWRRWRRRSDEIKYWRQSTDLGSLGIKGIESPELGQKDDAGVASHDDANLGQHSGEFNFGLPAEAMQTQDRIGLEERIVTLEIKLMDFEYAISKLQAGSMSPSRRHSERAEMAGRQNSVDSSLLSDHQQAPIEASPALPQETPSFSPSKFVHEIMPQQRPTSVATTLKATVSGPGASASKGSIDSSTRSSLPGLTIEHYTTLITLIRHEQSSRVRLEQQVSMLQQQLDRISPSQSSHSHAHSLSQHSHSHSLSSQQRRQGFVDVGNRGGHYRQPRPRSSSYSTNETDTDDDMYHDVYVTPDVTPVERGEYERGAFERVAGVEDGMAF